MTWAEIDTVRLMQLCNLFEEATGDPIDLNEFVYDDLYAYKALKRALESDVPELRRIAAHVEAQRNADIESLTIKPLEPLDATWKLDKLGGGYRVAQTEVRERRTPNRLLTADELLVVGRFKRLYQREFGREFDIGRFTRDDSYGRSVLQEALRSSNPFLVKLAKPFFDANGRYSQHRRGAG